MAMPFTALHLKVTYYPQHRGNYITNENLVIHILNIEICLLTLYFNDFLYYFKSIIRRYNYWITVMLFLIVSLLLMFSSAIC